MAIRLSRALYPLALVSLLIATLASASGASAQTDSGSDTEARTLFETGRAAYDAEHFDEAVRAFRRAYVLSPRFALLFNIGQAELRAGHDALALDAFEGFLRQAPADDARRSEVEERVRVLRAMGVSTAATAEVPPVTATETPVPPPATPTASETPPPSDSPRDEGPGVVPWIIVGVGGAVLVAGAVLMGIGAADAGRVTSAPDGSRWADLMGAAGSANTLWGVGIGLVVAGAVAAGVGIVWAVTAGGGGSEQGASARLRLGPSGLSLEGAF